MVTSFSQHGIMFCFRFHQSCVVISEKQFQPACLSCSASVSKHILPTLRNRMEPGVDRLQRLFFFAATTTMARERGIYLLWYFVIFLPGFSVTSWYEFLSVFVLTCLLLMSGIAREVVQCCYATVKFNIISKTE